MSDPGASLSRLYFFCAACALFATGYGLTELEPSRGMAAMLWVGPSVAVATWLAADGKRTGAVAAYDAGLFFYLTWPVTIPWYALRTRGRGGWGLAAQLYALAVVGMLGFVWGALLRWLIGIVAGRSGGVAVSLALLGTLMLGGYGERITAPEAEALLTAIEQPPPGDREGLEGGLVVPGNDRAG